MSRYSKPAEERTNAILYPHKNMCVTSAKPQIMQIADPKLSPWKIQASDIMLKDHLFKGECKL